MYKKLFVCLSLAAACAMSLAGTLDVTGQYHCQISPPGESKSFAGDLSISKAGEAYQLDWQFSKKINFQGTGMLGKSANILVVASRQVEDPSNMSLTAFKVSEQGDELNGHYVGVGATQVGVEICKKKK